MYSLYQYTYDVIDDNNAVFLYNDYIYDNILFISVIENVR